MKRNGFVPITLLFVAGFLVIAGSVWYYENHKGLPLVIKTNNKTTATTTNQHIATTTIQTPTAPSTFDASSSVQVGNFTVIADCKVASQVNQVEILKGSEIVQTILTPKGIAPGGESCPQPEAQDINFDGYPDFMIPSDYGSGGVSFNYWLFNTSTQQFDCPGDYQLGCTLINPGFDNASKTISESDSLGATDFISQLYKVNGDSLILYQETDTTSTGTTTLITVKQLENGQMVIMSSSTLPSGD